MARKAIRKKVQNKRTGAGQSYRLATGQGISQHVMIDVGGGISIHVLPTASKKGTPQRKRSYR